MALQVDHAALHPDAVHVDAQTQAVSLELRVPRRELDDDGEVGVGDGFDVAVDGVGAVLV